MSAHSVSPPTSGTSIAWSSAPRDGSARYPPGDEGGFGAFLREVEAPLCHTMVSRAEPVFQKRLAERMRRPWSIAVASDFAYPTTIGARPAPSPESEAEASYMRALGQLATQDIDAAAAMARGNRRSRSRRRIPVGASRPPRPRPRC
jgi:hypothetical protein